MSMILAYALALESKGKNEKNEKKGEKDLKENKLKACKVENNKNSFVRRILSLFKR